MSQRPLLPAPPPRSYPEICPPNMPTSNNSTSLTPGFGSFNIGNGFIEIAALTSLIGSATAQTLALGTKGPAGLVWATMTVFGGMSVVRAGVATVTPGWVRDSLGVRSTETDAAVGLSLDLNQKGTRYRTRAPPAKGVECVVENLDEPNEIGRRDIHVFDQRTTHVLNAVPAAKLGDPLKVYTYHQDPFFEESISRQAWLDWIYLALSSIKLVEVGVLWKYNAVTLAWVTLLTYLFFLLAAISLQIHAQLLHRTQSKPSSVVDTMAASPLPIPSSAGGSRKIVLGVPVAERRYAIWTIVWVLSSVACTASVISIYMALGQGSDMQVFFIWTSFQVLWIGLRSTFFHMVEDRERPYLASLKGKLWAELSIPDKTRVRNLAAAAAKYQYHIHPRGPWSYNEDVDVLQDLPTVYAEYPSTISPTSTSHQISVEAVIGDTLLSSTSWLSGSKRGGFEFYDTCIIILSLKGSTVAIPSTRVLAACRPKGPTEPDPEQGDGPERPPRGSSNMAVDIEWYFWVPCAEGKWLYFNSTDLKFKGTMNAFVLSDQQVTERLERGELFVSLKGVEEVREIVKVSTEACEYLSTLFS